MSQALTAPVGLDFLFEHVELSFREDLGRTLISKRDFERNEVVFREAPLMVWSESDKFSYIQKYLEQASSTQSAILDMYVPDLSSDSHPRVHEQRTIASEIFDMLQAPNVETIHKLLMIRDINAHAYYGDISEASTGVVAGGSRVSRTALYEYGSKVAHSCAPNLTYTSKWGDGMGSFIANKPIKKGEILTYGYVSCYDSPTFLRRLRLLDEKSFYCECMRCRGPDYNRGFSCEQLSRKACPGGVLINRDCCDSWQCNLCGVEYNGTTDEPTSSTGRSSEQEFIDSEEELGPSDVNINQLLMEKEELFSERLAAFKDIGNSNFMVLNLDYLDEFLGELLEWLCPTHYLVIDCLRLYNLIGNSQCRHYYADRFSTTEENFSQYLETKIKTIAAGVKLICCLECTAAQCCGYGANINDSSNKVNKAVKVDDSDTAAAMVRFRMSCSTPQVVRDVILRGALHAITIDTDSGTETICESERHPTVNESSSLIAWVFQDLMEVARAARQAIVVFPAAAAAASQWDADIELFSEVTRDFAMRYLDVLLCDYGINDADVTSMLELLAASRLCGGDAQ